MLKCPHRRGNQVGRRHMALSPPACQFGRADCGIYRLPIPWPIPRLGVFDFVGSSSIADARVNPIRFSVASVARVVTPEHSNKKVLDSNAPSQRHWPFRFPAAVVNPSSSTPGRSWTEGIRTEPNLRLLSLSRKQNRALRIQHCT